jgi:hypothetical protein
MAVLTRRITPPVNWLTTAEFAALWLGSYGRFPNFHQHCEPLPKNGVAKRSSIGRNQMAVTKTGGSKRGFAAMDPAKQREIASKGGKASHGGGRKAASHR